eukprot:gene6469-3087_t
MLFLLVATFFVLTNCHSILISPRPRNAIDTLDKRWGSDGSSPDVWQPALGSVHGAACACRNGTQGAACLSGQTCLWMSVGCTIGCKECDGGMIGTKSVGTNPNGIDRCSSGMQPTNNNPQHRTFNRNCTGGCIGSADDYTKHNPWRAPGSAPVYDPCGPAAVGLGSMAFFENSSATLAGEAQMHIDEVAKYSRYDLAIAGWGADGASMPSGSKEEEKLANISRLIKAAGTGTVTAVYAGQFEMAVLEYDLQRAVIENPAYSGFFLHDDQGNKILRNNGNLLWDFRNASAVQYHTEKVTGYFADKVTGAGVDAVFFDEGDSLACQYDCAGYKMCRTMPNATAWHEGDVDAWVGAAKIMAAAGKRAILSSQNGFAANSPILWKEAKPKGCPIKEDAIVARMKAEGVPFYRFYEYWLVPEQWSGGKANPGWMPGRGEPGSHREKVWQYCRNQVANAVEEGKTPNVNFVAAGTSALSQNGFGTQDRLKALEYSFAGFLVAKSRVVGPWGNRSDYFGFDHQFTVPNGAGCNHTRWGDCSTNVDELQTVTGKDYGDALDDAEEVSPGRWIRHFSKLNVTFDCGKHGPSEAVYDWA